MSDNTVASAEAVQEIKTAAEQSTAAVTAAADNAAATDGVSALLVDAVKSISDVSYRTISKICDTVQALAEK